MKKVILGICIALCCVAVRGNAANAGSYGPVQAGETLYRIALKYRQQSVTMSQMMMSIFEANPDAFLRENINRLKIGETLDIPALETVAPRINPDEAYREVTAQIETYELEVRPLQAEGGELVVLEPAEPEPAAGAAMAAAISEPSQAQIDEIKVELAADELQSAQQVALPEPKPARGKRKSSSKDPVFRYSYDISLIDDDNIRLAQEDEDIRSDRSLSATIRAKGGTSLDSFSILNYGGSASYNKMDTFETLDNYEIEVNTRYRFALSSGFTSPIYSTDTINMTTGVGYNAQESRSEVFDTSDARIFVNFDTNFSQADLVYTTFTYISGDTVSSASPSLGIINVADAIEPDDAFGGFATNQFAYRLKANTAVITLGYNRILTRDLSMDLSARFVDSEARDDDSITYQRTILRASLLGRF